MNEPKVKKYVDNELTALEKAVNYAEERAAISDLYWQDPDVIEKIHQVHSGQRLAYSEFLRVAWGKAVRIKSEYKGEIIYRLSQSSAIFPIPGINLATPGSPIGRLVSIAQAGDEYESGMLGEYRIEDVWYFERFTGHEYHKNVKNFKSMTSYGENVFSIKDLIQWLKNIVKGDDVFVIETAKVDSQLSSWEDITFEEASTQDISADPVSHFEEEKGISLSTKFYVNLIESQYDAAHWGANGLVFVFGIAGSGKTSVALGRSKSLAQLGQVPKNDEMYNPDFSEETQIGIVRTGELIKYLKDTCDMLALYRLPVVEYREIYEELKLHWNIDMLLGAKNTSPKFFLTPQNNEDSAIDAKMNWFCIVSDAMINIYCEQVLLSVKNKKIMKVANIDGDIFIKIYDLIYRELSSILSNNKNLIGFLNKIENIIKRSIDRIFNQSVWIGIPIDDGNFSWLSDIEHDIANTIVSLNKKLCLFNNINDIKIIVPEIEKENWKEWVPIKIEEASNKDDSIPKAVSLFINDSKIKKFELVVANNTQIKDYAKMGRLCFYDKIETKTNTLITKKFLLADMRKMVESNENQEGAEKNARQWRIRIRSHVLNNLQKILGRLIPFELFTKAIENLNNSAEVDYEFSSTLNRKLEQIKKKQLEEADIDLLLAFMISITRGVEKDSILFNSKNWLHPAPYRSSVFIDEAQDFSEIQVYLLSLLSDPKYNSVTAVGDSAQSLYNFSSDISVSFPSEMWANAKKQELTSNIRQQDVPTLNALSAAFRKKFIDDINIQSFKNIKNEAVDVYHRVASVDQVKLAYDIISNIRKNESVVIVVPSIERAEEAILLLKPLLREHQHRECDFSSTIDLSKKYIAHVTTPKNIKGLEFDHLIALYLEEYNFKKAQQKNSVYVIITRPKKKLSLIGDFTNVEPNFYALLEEFADIKK